LFGKNKSSFYKGVAVNLDNYWACGVCDKMLSLR